LVKYREEYQRRRKAKELGMTLKELEEQEKLSQ
jgi:hypothetical protein